MIVVWVLLGVLCACSVGQLVFGILIWRRPVVVFQEEIEEEDVREEIEEREKAAAEQESKLRKRERHLDRLQKMMRAVDLGKIGRR